MFWGITPALDLFEEYENIGGKLKRQSEINVLLVGGTDCRHVLKTLARRYRHEEVTVNFYLVEACMETVAKQLLLLNTALQPPEAMGLDQKTKIFMELYGNALVRPSVAKYLTNVAIDFVKMITNYDYLKEKMSFVTMDIKYKERDYLENLLKFWCSKDDFNIMSCWDGRLRKTLGVRYDSKLGAFDWDLHMRMHNVGGNQVCNQEYRNFRLNGIAFSWLESEVSKPNRSFVCAVIPNGESMAHYGYLGDMETGPFIAYGLDCEDNSFLKSTNGQNVYRATDVTERNLKQIFYEIEHKEAYEHKKVNDFQLGGAVLKQEKLIVDVKAVDVTPKLTKKCLTLTKASVTFLSVTTLSTMKFKSKFHNNFDIIYFAHNYLKDFDWQAMENVRKDKSILLIENQLFILNKRKKDLECYAKQVKEKLGKLNTRTIDIDLDKDCYFRYLMEETKL